MRHRVSTRHFNRNSKQRAGLFKGLMRSLIEQGEIVTTKMKAKEIKRLADKFICRAMKADVASRRLLHEYFGKRDVVNTLVDRIAPLFKGRVSGFTTTTNLGNRRGDNTEMVQIGLLVKPERTGNLTPEKAASGEVTVAKKSAATKTAAKPAKKAAEVEEKKTEKTTAKAAPKRKAAATK